jgi:hypothetical protein
MFLFYDFSIRFWNGYDSEICGFFGGVFNLYFNIDNNENTCYLLSRKSLNSDGEHFYQYQQNQQ